MKIVERIDAKENCFDTPGVIAKRLSLFIVEVDNAYEA